MSLVVPPDSGRGLPPHHAAAAPRDGSDSPCRSVSSPALEQSVSSQEKRLRTVNPYLRMVHIILSGATAPCLPSTHNWRAEL